MTSFNKWKILYYWLIGSVWAAISSGILYWVKWSADFIKAHPKGPEFDIGSVMALAGMMVGMMAFVFVAFGVGRVLLAIISIIVELRLVANFMSVCRRMWRTLKERADV